MTRRFPALAAAVAAPTLAAWALAVSLQPPPAAVPERGVVLDGVTLVNPGVERLAAQRLVVRGGRIERIEPSSEAGSHAGAIVLPGLIDLHVHHPPPPALGERSLFALLFLAHGVTSVRDVGTWLPDTLRRHRDRIADGEVPGPRIFQCGPFVDGAPARWPGSLVARDAQEASAVVQELAAWGADCIKIYNGLGQSAVVGVLAAASEAGLPVLGHLPRGTNVSRLRDFEMQHLMGLGPDWGNVSKALLMRYVRRSRENGIRHTPTLVAFAHMARAGDPDAWRDDPAMQLLPRYYPELLWRIDRNPLARLQFETDGGAESARLETMRRAVALLRDAGVPVLAGTDLLAPGVVPGAALQEELRQLVAAGLTLEEAWAAATRLAGEALGVPRLGTVSVGAPADLLIFREDPTRDLDALSSLEAVVADGRLYSRAQLDEAVERARSHFRGFPYDPLSFALARVSVWWLGRGVD